MPARDLERLTREIADAKQWLGVKAAAPVGSCYEAGRDGFWLHRYLTSIGVANVVVDSSSIEVNRRLRRAKSDALDVRKLLGMLLRYTRANATCGAWCESPRSRRRIGASCIASSGP
jgi:transposase